MKVFCGETYEEASKIAASIIADQIKNKDNSVLGLATGSTPIGTYKNLVEMNKSGEISFKNITSVNLDEYQGLDGSHDQSYRYFMNTNLFDHVDIDKSKTFVPNGSEADDVKACDDYEKTIASVGGVDLQLLGLGHNGHIGFNEPGTPFDSKTHKVALTESTINANSRLFASIDDVPRFAYTMGIGTIMSAKAVLLLVTGEDKRDIIDKVCHGPVTEDVPASVLQNHPNVILVGDKAALGDNFAAELR
ncbi:MAG: glucosamine-6-phosphate deaminase [Lachnospiraceae bacterium]|nr:glucosamine-6-phosphate deaminase [Lachnospiraceae bacterium]